MGMWPRHRTLIVSLRAVGMVLCGEAAFAVAIGGAALIVASPILCAPAYDPATVRGHLDTCPKCSDVESDPLRCRMLREMNLRSYRRELEAAHRNPTVGQGRGSGPRGELPEHRPVNRSTRSPIPGAFDSRLPAQFSLLNPPRVIHPATSEGRTPRPGMISMWGRPMPRQALRVVLAPGELTDPNRRVGSDRRTFSSVRAR